nr:putative inactive purple acid phosphatase 9 [Quercus suber]
MWLKDSTCEDVIKQSWEGESSPNIDRGFNRKITACRLNLRAWNRNCFGHVHNTLAKKLKDLKWAEEEGCYASNPGKIYQLREEIQKLKYREESMWKQRSRNAWLKEGDSNTRYFHCRANQRNQRNFISSLEDNDGGWVEEESRLGGIVKDYFRTIFSSSNPSGFDSILQGIHPAITEEAAELLGRDFQADEEHNPLSGIAHLLAKLVEVGFGSSQVLEQIHLGFTENADEMRVMFLMGDPKKRGVRFGLREGKLDRVAMASVET